MEDIQGTWVRFWAGGTVQKSEHEHYEWFDRPMDEVKDAGELKELAEDEVPNWIRSRSNYHYGYSVVSVLPEAVRLRLVNRYRHQKEHAERMLNLVRDPLESMAAIALEEPK